MDGGDDFFGVDALEVDAGGAEVGVSELALDHVERYAFTCELDGVGVAELVWREASAHAGPDGEAPKLDADGGARPRPAACWAVDHAEQRPDWKLDSLTEPGCELFPAPTIHPDLASAAAFAAANQQRPAPLVKVLLAER